MSLHGIIQQIDSEISRLQQVRRILQGPSGPSVQASQKNSMGSRGPTRLSAEARRRISEAQKRRWAEQRAGKKKK